MKTDLLTLTFQRLRPRLFQKARGVLADDEDARDVLQDVFFKLWSVRESIESERHAAGLATTTVRNLSIDRLRRKQVHPTDSISSTPELIDVPDASADDSRAETLRRVNMLIEANLSARDRQILILRDRDEWEFEEIALKFNITPANARLIVARARKTIRTLYNNHQP